MATLKVEGFINQDGELEFQMPPDHPVGKVTVTIEPAEISDDEWTDEELDTLLHPPESHMTGAEIVKMVEDFGHTGWMDITTDGETWVDELHRKRRTQNLW